MLGIWGYSRKICLFSCADSKELLVQFQVLLALSGRALRSFDVERVWGYLRDQKQKKKSKVREQIRPGANHRNSMSSKRQASLHMEMLDHAL